MSGDPPRPSRYLTLAAAAAVLVLAVAALLMPHGIRRSDTLPLLVFDTAAAEWRVSEVHQPLATVLGEAAQRQTTLRVFGRKDSLLAAAEQDAFLLVPDGLAMELDPRRFVPVATLRRPAPHNLRPQGVLVYRRGTVPPPSPWLGAAERTVLGDSLSLSSVGAWALTGGPGPEMRLAAGPDPFDHGPALHALRMGCYDFALVRQWDAERFMDCGLLDPSQWAMIAVTPPVSDLIVLAPRTLPAPWRLRVGDTLRRLGRESDATTPAGQRLAAGLVRLQMSGFNPVLETDLDALRRQWATDWPETDD